MGDYWPSGVELHDREAPIEILEKAKDDWLTQSDGLMTLEFQFAKSQDGNHMIIVHAKSVVKNRTATIFSVVSRASNPYPVTIQPNDDNIPNYLKKTYYRPGSDSLAALSIPNLLKSTEGRTIENRWVSDSPQEFREKLVQAFNLGVVKSAVLNLNCELPVTPTTLEESAQIDDIDLSDIDPESPDESSTTEEN